MFDPNSEKLTIGVAGTGLMGRGIAQIAVQAGIRVILHDARPGAAAEARDSIATTLATLATKGKISEADSVAAAGRLQLGGRVADLADCALVIEAIVEDLAAKRELFGRIEEFVSEDCILATNTSSLSVTAIAAGCRLPSRVAGFHFFSPVPLMKVVEVIDGALTAPAACEALCALARRFGHTAVRAQDTPGFIVNHAGRGFGTEALRILGEGIAGIEDIDRVLRQAADFRMGPFELFDLIGLDVSQPVMDSMYEQFYQEPRFRPSPIIRQRVAAGLLGRKSGRGFYAYREGVAERSAEEPIGAPAGRPVWIGRRDADAAERARALLARLGATVEAGERPSGDALCIVTPIGEDATTATLAEHLDATRTVALDTLALDGRRTLMRTPLTTREVADEACRIFGSDGIPVTLINDSPGFIAQRVLATIINIGCEIAQQRIASPQDIDRAVTLGLGYPKGPLALGDSIGARKVLAILDNMHAFYRDPRYRPSPWLIRRARLGLSLSTPED